MKILHYRIVEELKRSTTNIIYRAVDERSSRFVILKMPSSDFPAKDEIIALEREYVLLHRLEYDGIIKTYALETIGNSVFMVLEDFDSVPLHAVFRKSTFPMARKIDYAMKIASGILQIHGSGIIHKDIKPSNIFVNEKTDEVKIADFSISQTFEEAAQQNESLLLTGTLSYMSPEQTGEMKYPLDFRTDFYSFGITLYQFFTGELPFKSRNPRDIITEHVSGYPKDPSLISRDISGHLSAIILKLMAKNPDDRFRTDEEMITEMERFRTGLFR